MVTPAPAKSEKKIHTCQACGHTGEDVIKDMAWVGGQGYVGVTYCADIDACLKRRNDVAL